MAELINGNVIAAQIRVELKEAVASMKNTLNVTPGLAVILVGERRDSATYVRSKKKACAEIGMESYGFDYPADVSQEELVAKIDELNAGFSCINISLSFYYN
jgi:5,10-methylene-tetrahydrofolate dehydrogenase/methenyl tetrahydrofolate cyclohydrolase